jgi:hypothetical protein
MNDHSLNELLARARACPPDTSGDEFAFETRLLAKLREDRHADERAPLAWRLCPWFVVPAAALAIWAIYNPPDIYPYSLTGENHDIQLAEYLTGTSL